MGRMVISFVGVVVTLLLICETTKAQAQFTITESVETVDVGSITAVGSRFRFEGGSPPCQEIFTIDESGSIRTTKGIDRESRIIANNVDDFGWLSCTVAYLTNDGNNSTRRIQIAIADVNDNAPEFSNLTGISVKENTNVNSIVQVFTVKDPDNGDNGTVDSVVLGGMDERFFHLVTSQVGGLVTVQLQASNENIDFEMYRQLNITLTATDRGTPPKTSSTEVTVTVEDINDNAPVFSYTQYNFKNVADTTPSDVPIGSVNATDDDEGIFGIVLYGITRVRGVGTSCGNVDELFAINSTTGAIYLNQSANGIRCEYTLRILAYNNHGDASRMGNAAVHVPIVAAVLVFEPPENYYTLIEERPSKLYTWTVKGGINCNNPQFNEMISSTHFCTMLPNSVTHSILFTGIDREETPFISGTIVVDSGAGPDEPPLPGTLNFNFTVLDINDNAPVFENTTFSVPENSRVGYEIGRVVAVDADEGDNGSVIYELLNSTHEDLITLDSNGMLVVNDTIDFEQVERIELFVIAQDQGTPPMDQEEIIYINIENLNDELPKFSNNFDQRILTTSSLPFIWYVTATDDDSGEFGEVTFRKVVTSTPNDASTFVTLNVSQLRIEELPEPSSTPYQLVVEAVDGGNGTSNVTITINVWTDICQDNPCRNGGICTNENNSYKCACTEDYGGENCSILKNPCEHTHPCLNGGSCSDTEDELDYRCTCTDNFSGRNCNYNTVSFKPRSFQSYQLPGVSANSRDLQVSVQVAPKFLNGLLLYVGEGDNFISMELDNGRVVMRSTPNGEISDDTMMVTTNGIWYLITMIMKSGTEPSVNVSRDLDITNSNQFPSEEHMDDVAGTVFIGGLSAGSTIPYEHIRNPDYVGCMRDLFINGKRVHLSGEDQQRQSHNVEDGCNLELLRSGDTECERERCVDLLSGTECERKGYIDFLLNSRPYCDCALPSSNCTGVPTAVGFTGQANLIVETLNDFFIAIQQSRHKLKPTEPDVEQVVSFSFRSTTEEAVLLSAAVQRNNLRVFWFGNDSLNYDIYEGDTRCGRVSLTGIFNDNKRYTVDLTVRNNKNVMLVVGDGQDYNTTAATMTCSSSLFVEFPSSTVTITGRPAMDLSTRLPDKDFQGCISDLTVDKITVPLAKNYTSKLVMLQEEGSVNEVHNGCEPDLGQISGEEGDANFFQLYVIVIMAVVVILVLVCLSVAVIWFGRKCLHRRPNKSRYDMPQEMPDYQDSPPNTLNFRKKTEFDNASVGHYQEEGEEAMPDATAISIDSLRKSACNSSGSGGTGSSAETGFHTGSERDHTSDAGFPDSAAMINDETPSEVQESEYSTFISDSDITSAVEQTLSPLDVQLLGPPNVLGMPPPPQARNMTRKPSPSMKDPTMLPMERKISPFHPHSRFSMSTIESGSESSLGPPPPPDPILKYSHPSSIHQHEPRLPGLKTLCGPDFNPISYWEQQSRLKPSIDLDYPLQRLSLASGRGTEDPSSTISVASTLEEQHEFASQGGGEGEATNMRDGLESDHELDYRLADLHIPEYESMTLSQSTLVGGSEEYFPDATVKPCHPIVPVHDNSVSSNSPYHTTLPDHLYSPQSISSSSSSTGYRKNSHQRLLSEQDLSTHDRYYMRSRTGASKPPHMISDRRLHAQYSNSSTSSASTPQTRRAWRSEDPINV